jgi:hypothetical protein
MSFFNKPLFKAESRLTYDVFWQPKRIQFYTLGTGVACMINALYNLGARMINAFYNPGAGVARTAA